MNAGFWIVFTIYLDVCICLVLCTNLICSILDSFPCLMRKIYLFYLSSLSKKIQLLNCSVFCHNSNSPISVSPSVCLSVCLSICHKAKPSHLHHHHHPTNNPIPPSSQTAFTILGRFIFQLILQLLRFSDCCLMFFITFSCKRPWSHCAGLTNINDSWPKYTFRHSSNIQYTKMVKKYTKLQIFTVKLYYSFILAI